jgi:ribonuclease J
LDLDPAGGVYIYSSSEAHTEEQQLDLERLLRWIERFGMEPVGLRRGPNGQPEPTAGYHASGHASGEDLLEIARRIRPEKLLPIHTEHSEVFLELQGEMEVLLARDGERLRLP